MNENLYQGSHFFFLQPKLRMCMSIIEKYLVVGPRESDNETFGQFLKTLRIQKGLSRAQAAEKFGFSSEYLRLIERGKRTPTWGNMPMIFGVYDVNYVLVEEQFVVEKTAIEFTSRIRETRHKIVSHAVPDLHRAQQIVQIVELLMQTDDRKLCAVHKLLLKS